MDSEAHPIGAGLRLLVVNDEPAVAQYLESALSALGFKVALCASLNDARQRAMRAEFDVAMIDQRLPDGDGLPFCRELAAARADCKVVLMSNDANLAAALEALQCGVADYLVKPIDAIRLGDRLRRVVELLRHERGNNRLVEVLREKNAELEDLAVRDPLTRLFNHGHLQVGLAREVSRSERYSHGFALALLDLDRFKELNERHGHAVGDRVLREVSAVLRSRSRKSDLPFRLAEQDVVARYAGDVFALILPETDRGGAATKLESLRRAVRELRLDIEGLAAPTLSVGFACFPQDGTDREKLIEAAQRALATAKRAGGNQLVSYSAAVEAGGEQAAVQAASKARALGRSLAEASFRFVYQPIVDARLRTLFAYEALCRPTDPDFANVGELLETAVRTGRVCDLGRVLRRIAVEQMPGLAAPCSLFVNIHPQDLNDSRLLELEAHLAPWVDRLVFEVTETEAIRDYARARDRIKGLQDHGFRVALDDLGSGYSSLNLLAQLEPDFVKLDMELVRGLDREGRQARLIRHLLDFCRGEGFATIAEGIETTAELHAVTELGVDFVQGYLLAWPSPPFCSIEYDFK